MFSLFDKKIELSEGINIHRTLKDIFGISMPGDSCYGVFSDIHCDKGINDTNTKKIIFEGYDEQLFDLIQHNSTETDYSKIINPLLIWQSSVICEIFTGLLGSIRTTPF